jgi:predicted nuclease of predicted toxin-antitoxin system
MQGETGSQTKSCNFKGLRDVKIVTKDSDFAFLAILTTTL